MSIYTDLYHALIDARQMIQPNLPPKQMASLSPCIARSLLTGLLTLVFCGQTHAGFGDQLTSAELEHIKAEGRIIVDFLQNTHVSGRGFRDLDSKGFLTEFLDELDDEAEYFTKDDLAYIIRRFNRSLRTVYLFRGDPRPAFEIFDLFLERCREREAWALKTLDGEIHLDGDSVIKDEDKTGRVTNRAELEERWLRRLQDQLIAEVTAGRTEKDARQTLRQRYTDATNQVAGYDPYEVRAYFWDAVIRQFDPHSGYFSSETADEFSHNMGKQVVGVGLDLQKRLGQCIVSGVQSGSSADLESTIAPGDTIIAIANHEKPVVDARKARLRDIIDALRGPAESSVTITYCPAGSEEKIEAKLERAKVELISRRARGAVAAVADTHGTKRNIGWITLPDFYAGDKTESTASAAEDMRELIATMSGNGPLDGLVIDLRNNPGGAMPEAVAVSGLFLSSGVVSLNRGLDGKLVEQSIKETVPAYLGPLVVLTSPRSASASEIFAGVMRHYRRAVIVGGAATYGKGTMQAYVDLKRLPGNRGTERKYWGALRVTASHFHLPDGGAIQGTGVPSDIEFPGMASAKLKRESDLPHFLAPLSLKHDSAAPSPLPGQSSVTDPLLQVLRICSENNIATLPEWHLWNEERSWAEAQDARSERSLNLEDRITRWDEEQSLFDDLQQRRRVLTATAAFPVTAIELNAVQSLLDEREERLRKLQEDSGIVLGRLYRGAYYFENEAGRIRALSLRALHPARYHGNADDLAAAFETASGYAASPDQAWQILRRHQLSPQQTRQSLLQAARDTTGDQPADEKLTAGLEAMLNVLVNSDDDLRAVRPPLDVPLREAMRIAAEWKRTESRSVSVPTTP